jgi:GABA(A) receptor-associated protein
MWPLQLLPFEERFAQSGNVLLKYPERIPVIVGTRKEINLDKQKYLVPRDLTVGQFIHVIRKRIEIKPETALFFFTENNQLPPNSTLMGNLYQDCKNKDGFLYVSIALENTFGYNR